MTVLAGAPHRGQAPPSLCPAWEGPGRLPPPAQPTVPTPGGTPALPGWSPPQSSLNDREIGPAGSASKPGRCAQDTGEPDLRAGPWPPLSSEPLLDPQVPPHTLRTALLIVPLRVSGEGPTVLTSQGRNSLVGERSEPRVTPIATPKWEGVLKGLWGLRELRHAPKGGEQTHLGTSSQ